LVFCYLSINLIKYSKTIVYFPQSIDRWLFLFPTWGCCLVLILNVWNKHDIAFVNRHYCNIGEGMGEKGGGGGVSGILDKCYTYLLRHGV